MNQSRETMSGANDDWQLSSVFDNSNTFSDELDSIIMADWDDARGSMMLDWPFDDQKLVPDSSQIGDQVATTGTQCFSDCDPSLQASQDAMASGTTGINVPHNGIAPLSDMFASHLELDQSFIDPELFKRSPVLIPNYTVPIFPGSTYQQFPATSAPFPSRLLNDEMYENTVLRMFPPPQDLPVLAQKLIDSSMMEKAIIHSGKPTAARTEEAFDDAALQSRGSAQSMIIKTDNGIAGVRHPSTIIGDRQGAAARMVRPARETPVVIGASVKDGYNWRKYGQKNMKDSNFPRSYYRCTYPHCKTTKKEERSPQGFVTEIIYKGVHNHPKPNCFPCPSSYPEQGVRRNASQRQKQHGTHFSSKMSSDHVVEGDDADSNRQKKEFNALETMRSSSRSPRQVKYLVLVFADFDVIDDGYRWRKYGSKVVKGNTNPRSYYKCTDPGCKARKLVERSPDDCKKLMSTYEGTHNHEVPGPKKGSSSSNNTSSSAISSSSARPSSVLPQANGSLAPRTELAARDNFMKFGYPSPLGIVSLPRSLPTLPAAVNPLGMVAVAPLPPRMRMPILPQLSSYPGFRAPLQSGLTTTVIPKLDPTDQHPPSETQQLALQPAGDGAATSRPRN